MSMDPEKHEATTRASDMREREKVARDARWERKYKNSRG